MKRKKTHKTTKNTQPKNKRIKEQEYLLNDIIAKMNHLLDSNPFNDVLHDDGSKTYETLNYGNITIKNPDFVKEIESILECNYTGWGYMPRLEKFVAEGKDVYDEINKVIDILD